MNVQSVMQRQKFAIRFCRLLMYRNRALDFSIYCSLCTIDQEEKTETI